MPRIVMELTIEKDDEGAAGFQTAQEFIADVRNNLTDYTVVSWDLMGTTLTQHELDLIRFDGECGHDD